MMYCVCTYENAYNTTFTIKNKERFYNCVVHIIM